MSSNDDSMPSGSAKKFRLISYAIFIVAIIIFTAGAAMLGIGIGKSNDSKNNMNLGDNSATAAPPVATGAPPVSQELLKAKPMDLVFLVDQTTATVNNFNQILQFLSTYVTNFNIGLMDTQVAVVGCTSAPIFNETAMYIHFKDASNLGDLQAKIAKIPAGNSADNGLPNIHRACEYIMQTTFQPHNGRRIDIPVVIVVLLGSDRLDPVYYNTETALWRSTDLFGISLLGHTATTETLIKFTRNAQTVVQVGSFDDLLIPNNVAVQQLSKFIFSIAPQRPVRLTDVRSDIVVLIDVTNSMVEDAFNNTMRWLKSFTGYFTINNSEMTQLSVILFDSAVRTTSFHLNSASNANNAALQTMVGNLKWPNSTVQNFNLLNALQYVTDTVLMPAQGWRQQSTYILVIAISPETVNTCDDIKNKGTVPLAQKADIYAMALGGLLSVENYLYCVLPPFPRLHLAKAVPYNFLIPAGLTDTVYANEAARPVQTTKAPKASGINKAWFDKMPSGLLFGSQWFRRSYQRWVDRQSFNAPTLLNELQIDIVFLIDQTLFLSQATFKRLQDLLLDFLNNGQYNISASAIKVSVVSYDDKAVFNDGSFALNRANNLDDLLTAVNELKWNSASSAQSLNLAGALDYLSGTTLTAAQGHDVTRPSAIIILASAPSIVSQLSAAQIKLLNDMGGVYGVDVANIGAGANYLIKATIANDSGSLNPNSEIEVIQRLNSFVSNVAYSWKKQTITS